MTEPFEPAAGSTASSSSRPDEDEIVYFEGSPLMRGELGKTISLFTLGAVIFFLPLITSLLDWWSPPWWVVLIFIAVGGGVAALPYLMVKTVRYRITNYRIDFERGILTKAIDTLELWHVDDISFRQSLIARLLRVGTITVVSSDATTPRLTMHGLPNARTIFDQLKQRVIAVKRQRGVIKMDMGGAAFGA